MNMYLLAFLALIKISFSHLDINKLVNDQSIVSIVNEANTTWKAEVSERFVDTTLRDFQKLLGTRKTSKENKLPTKEFKLYYDELPENFDSREKWSRCSSIQEIRDQSSCGSCWALASVESMSDRVCISSNQVLQTRVSAENLLACCKQCGDGCKGGEPSIAWKYYVENGLPSGGLYKDFNTCQPYSMPPCDHHVTGRFGPCPKDDYPTPKCQSECNANYGKTLEQDLTFAKNSYSIKGESEIQKEIYILGPVVASFIVHEDFPLYRTGVYQYKTGKVLGGHSIKIIGWGVENGVKYWLCVNSWNDGWGDKGTFKILRGSNHCQIEDDVIAGTIKVNGDSLLFLDQ